MNFLLASLRVLDKAAYGTNFFKYLTKAKFSKTAFTNLQVLPVTETDYLGYNPNDIHYSTLLFTKTFLKAFEIHSPAVNHVFISIARNEFTNGNKLRSVGNLKSVILPGSRNRKVILFTSVTKLGCYQTQILLGISDAYYWETHAESLSQKNGFKKKADNARNYYKSFITNGFSLLYPGIRQN